MKSLLDSLVLMSKVGQQGLFLELVFNGRVPLGMFWIAMRIKHVYKECRQNLMLCTRCLYFACHTLFSPTQTINKQQTHNNITP